MAHRCLLHPLLKYFKTVHFSLLLGIKVLEKKNRNFQSDVFSYISQFMLNNVFNILEFLKKTYEMKCK